MTDCTQITLGICSDTHGEQLPQWLGRKVNAVLHAGDIYDAPRMTHGWGYISPRTWAKNLGVPVLAVRGNHDFRDPDEFFMAAEDISGRLVRVAEELWVAGVGFAPPWFCDAPGESDLRPQCHDLIRMAQRQVIPGQSLILLTHYPPKIPTVLGYGASGSWTYTCLAELAEIHRPVAIVFGHQHEWFGRQWRRQDGTLLVNPGPRGGVLTITANGEVTFDTG